MAYLVRRHYEKLGLHLWDNARVARLARMMHCTPEEICAYAGISKANFDARWKRGKWPTENGLVFTLLESFWLEQFMGIRRQPVIPIGRIIIDDET